MVILLLYAATWVGGRPTHARNVKAAAWAKYETAREHNARWLARQPPGTELPIYARLLEGGPAVGVNWCVPLLPGVLLADSYEVLGPLSGRASYQIVLYYGIDSVIICEAQHWVS